MTIRFIAGKAALVLWAVVCLGTTAIPLAQAQAVKAADRAAKKALRRNKAKTRPGAQGIQPHDRRPRGRGPIAGRRARGVNPHVIERLMRMPPAQRRRFLRDNPRFQRLPKDERERIQRRLRELDRMPANQRELALERYELFRRLSPEKQQQARSTYRRWREIPQRRRKELLQEFRQLRQATPEMRQERFTSKDFTKKYSESERQILKDLTSLLPARPID